MQPYDYTKENYSKLGYVCEGVTTYYGDYLLYRCGVFNEQQFLDTFAERLQKHFDNFGRFNLSVADSSFDTWIDGYVPGIPNRKTNIYDEGNLLAFVTDILIRKSSSNKNNLDDVMRYLYSEFALKGKGYSDIDYKSVVEHFAGVSFDNIFANFINKPADYTLILSEALEYIGCELEISPASKYHEHALGIKVNEVGGLCKVTSVFLDSVADKAGIAVNDDIMSINNMQIKTDASGTNFTEWCNYYGNSKLSINIATMGVVKKVKLSPQENMFYKTVKMVKKKSPSDTQKNNFEIWSNNKF